MTSQLFAKRMNCGPIARPRLAVPRSVKLASNRQPLPLPPPTAVAGGVAERRTTQPDALVEPIMLNDLPRGTVRHPAPKTGLGQRSPQHEDSTLADASDAVSSGVAGVSNSSVSSKGLVLKPIAKPDPEVAADNAAAATDSMEELALGPRPEICMREVTLEPMITPPPNVTVADSSIRATLAEQLSAATDAPAVSPVDDDAVVNLDVSLPDGTPNMDPDATPVSLSGQLYKQGPPQEHSARMYLQARAADRLKRTLAQVNGEC